MARQIECHRPGCRVKISARMFACTPDWFSLPAAIRTRVNNAWAARRADPGDEAKMREHLAAKAEALSFWAEQASRAATS